MLFCRSVVLVSILRGCWLLLDAWTLVLRGMRTADWLLLLSLVARGILISTVGWIAVRTRIRDERRGGKSSVFNRLAGEGGEEDKKKQVRRAGVEWYWKASKPLGKFDDRCR
jgi:hypothetical protein